jgi:Ca2+-binding EF-hand superfamily protein
LKIILNQMRDTEIKQMHQKFIEFDLEKNGVITVEEMKQIMHDMG